MQQLNFIDASFIYTERVGAPQLISMISLYDPVTATVRFPAIKANVASRLHLARAFRQKLVRAPFDLDLPYWIEDPDFDIDAHVHRTAVPRLVTWPQFWTEIAGICATPLDSDRPLWALHVIDELDGLDGLPPGAFATVLKVHHAAVDGVAGMELFTALHDSTPDAAVHDETDPWSPEKAPTSTAMLGRAGVRGVRNLGPLAGRAIKAVPKLRRASRGGGLDRMTTASRDVPVTRFNGPLSPHRIIATRTFPLSQIKRIKAAVPGATVNDVALGLVGGALRLHLLADDSLPELPLIAGVPISVRTPDQAGAAGNEISGMMIPLGTHIADPRDRVTAIHEATQQAKEMADAIGARTLTELSAAMPGALFGLAARATSLIESRAGARRIQNTVVSNVPGPQEPLYNCGARMTALHVTGPLSDGMGLFHLISTYNGRFTVTVYACREMLPDPAAYGRCIDDSYAALLSLANAS